MNQTIPGIDPVLQAAFNPAYWAFQPIPVQKLQGMNPGPDRDALAHQLAGQFFIDVPVMDWGWDAYGTMLLRSISGYTTYPDATGTRSRPVDLDPTHYPPTPVPVPPVGFLVGPCIGGPGASPYYFLTQGAVNQNLPVGWETTEDGHMYVMQHITQEALDGRTQIIGRWFQVS